MSKWNGFNWKSETEEGTFREWAKTICGKVDGKLKNVLGPRAAEEARRA